MHSDGTGSGPDPDPDPDFGTDRAFMAVPREEREAADRADVRAARERAWARAKGKVEDRVHDAAATWGGPMIGASGRRDTRYIAEAGGFPLLDVHEIEGLSENEREGYLRALWAFSLEHDFPDDEDPWMVWERWTRRCTWEDTIENGGTGSGQRCDGESVAGTQKCIRHVTHREIDPAGYAADQAARARLRLAGALESAADAVEDILNAPTELPNGWEPGDPGPAPVSPALRLKAAELVFDRAGVPKVTESSVHAQVNSQVTVTDGRSPGEIIRARLTQLADSFTQTQLEGIAAATEAAVTTEAGTEAEIVDAEWTQDLDPDPDPDPEGPFSG